MTITLIRSPKNKSNPYTQIDNRLFDDERYHPDAVAFVSFALRNANNFKIAIPKLKKRFGSSGYRRRKKLAYECGLLKMITYLVPGNLGGMHKRYRYEIYENSYHNFKNEGVFPYEIQCVDSSTTGINTCIRKRVREKEKKEKKKKPISIPKICETPTLGDKPPNPPRLFFLNNQVRIKQELYDSLLAEYTEPIVTMGIDRMNAHMADTGKYQKYECHGTKLRAWLAKDAQQYRAKLEKQKQQEERKKQEDIEREQYAVYLEAQRQKELEKQRANEQRALLIAKRSEEKRQVIEGYAHKYSKWIKQSHIDVVNGVYWFMGECRIIEDDVESEIEKLIASHILSSDHREEAQERTERAIECDENMEVVYSIKKEKIQSQIGNSVLNLMPSVEKHPQKKQVKLGMCNFRFKSQINSLLKSYGQYPMGS